MTFITNISPGGKLKKQIEMKTKIVLILLMLGYVGWVFYLSEPKFKNNAHTQDVEVMDMLVIEESYGGKKLATVIQVGEGIALVKYSKYSMNTTYEEINLSSDSYRVIGRGTIYHKLNTYIGFNIMVITQVVIGILLIILIIKVIEEFN